MTDTDDDMPDNVTVVSDADLGIEPAVELDHRPISPEVLAAAFSWIALLPDQKLLRSRLKGLANALAAIADARRKLVDEHAAHDQKVVADRAELEAARTALQSRQVAAHVAEGQLQEREQRCVEREIELGLRAGDTDFVPLAGSTIARDTAWRTTRTDSGGREFPRNTTITRTEFVAPVAVPVRRGRPRAGA